MSSPRGVLCALVTLSVCFVSVRALAPYPYTFADHFSLTQLLTDADAAARFREQVITREGWFATDGNGLAAAYGVTNDGIDIDAHTGLPLPAGVHNFSAASKEAIHVGLMALALTAGANRYAPAT